MSRMVWWVCRYGSSRSSAAVSGDAPVAPAWPLAVMARRSSATSSTSVPSAGRWCRTSSISCSRWRAVIRSPSAQYTLASCSSDAHGEIGQRERQRRTGSHRLRQLAFGLVEVASVHSEPGRAGEGEHARRVVMHPILVDGAECTFDVLGRLRPPPTIHRQHGQLGLAVNERIGVGHRGCERGRLGEHGRGLVDVAGEQQRLGMHAQRRVAPDAPRRLLGGREAPVGQHLLGTGGAHPGPQHGPRRVERRRAVRGHEIERRRVDDRRPPLRLGGLPAEHRDPAGEHRQRGVLRDGGVAERRRANAARWRCGRPGRSAGPTPSPTGCSGPARPCSTSARPPSPGIHSTRTSRRHAGAAW